MDSVVTKLAVAIEPDPVPVVMNEVVLKRATWNRTLPTIVINVLRNFGILPFTNRCSSAKVNTASGMYGSDPSAMNKLYRLAIRWCTSTLRSNLYANFIFTSSGNLHFPFPRVLAAWLFYINVLTRFCGNDGCRSMPVIGSGTSDDIHFVILYKCFPGSDRLGTIAHFALDFIRSPLGSSFIHITNIFNDTVTMFGKRIR